MSDRIDNLERTLHTLMVHLERYLTNSREGFFDAALFKAIRKEFEGEVADGKRKQQETDPGEPPDSGE